VRPALAIAAIRTQRPKAVVHRTLALLIRQGLNGRGFRTLGWAPVDPWLYMTAGVKGSLTMLGQPGPGHAFGA